MCGGLWNVQSRRPPRLLDLAKLPPADAHLPLTSSRHRSASPAAGLAIVAELAQSASATSVLSSSSTSTSSLPISISPSSPSSEEEAAKDDHLLFARSAQKPTLFSTSLSPPSSYDIRSCTFHKEFSYGEFLGVCFFCKRPLGPGKDIYMYKGDQAFCSAECRYNQIVADENLQRVVHIDQQCVQASSQANRSEVTPLVAILI